MLAVVGLIESLMILLYDLRDGYRNSYFYVGVVFACAFGIRLLTNFDLPSIVYLLVIGIVIIGSVIYMIIYCIVSYVIINIYAKRLERRI